MSWTCSGVKTSKGSSLVIKHGCLCSYSQSSSPIQKDGEGHGRSIDHNQFYQATYKHGKFLNNRSRYLEDDVHIVPFMLERKDSKNLNGEIYKY
ncbi:1211_t:CDS:2 [Entrophospora sp. SA101]|nr:1211_t:CDS:2 [Entrophospora sp. SA101]